MTQCTFHSAKKLGLVISLFLFGLAVACQTKSGGSDDPAPDTTDTGGVQFHTTPVPFRQPANFPTPVYELSQNPLTVQGVALGKSLFYDTQLSRDSTVSCGFCHQQFAGFAHSDHALSHGIDNKFGTRNVPSLQNAAWGREFFWDGGITDLNTLFIAPLTNPVEMDMKFANVLARVQQSPKYPQMFKSAFGSDTVTTARFLKAISQFVLTLVSADSRYDKYVRKESGGDLTSDELAGLTLFKQKCATCHATDLFTDYSYRNNGLPVSSINDQGRYTITLNEADRLKFKVPSLRNVERTFPYMHDGRFTTLEQVLNHYSTGVKDSPTLDPALKANGQLGIALTATEQQQVISFLKTLTDNTFITNRAFGPN
ncbi:cytochrome-c peroxidase [Spirosoma endbachense]|uniref:Cytochrome-c peroxidase n=1 Tax=Spirosoma endbachense TaxID=2666025 RepID=A0A6P1W746_9BACT|nr:cytochrome c peroxidase [Spirosoma endbachense]QHW00735.1 cytochrome-c peroxidase [Spirosoma endbachense]